jgi:hypothetical protein
VEYGFGVLGRVLLLEDGHVVFATADVMMNFQDQDLSPLSDGIWPCADGGLRANPVSI